MERQSGQKSITTIDHRSRRSIIDRDERSSVLVVEDRELMIARDDRSSVSTIDHRSRRPIIGRDDRSSVSTIDHRSRRSIVGVAGRRLDDDQSPIGRWSKIHTVPAARVQGLPGARAYASCAARAALVQWAGTRNRPEHVFRAPLQRAVSWSSTPATIGACPRSSLRPAVFVSPATCRLPAPRLEVRVFIQARLRERFTLKFIYQSGVKMSL